MADIKQIQVGSTTYNIMDAYAPRTADVIPPMDEWRTNLGNPTVWESGIFDEQFTNKSAFWPRANILVETSNDDVTYTETTEFTDAQICGLFGGDAGGLLKVPTLTTTGTQYKRLTLTTNGYDYVNAIYIYCTHVSGNLQCKIDALNNTTGSWDVKGDYAEIGSWPGHVVRRLYIPWSSSGSNQYKKIRLTFKGVTTSASYLFHSIYKIQFWGGYPAGNRKIYTVGYDKKVTFPYIVQATSFTGNLTGTATNASNVTMTSNSTNASYPVLFKNSNNNSDETAKPRFDSDGLTNFNYNPSTNTLQATNITATTLNSVTIGASPKFTDTLNTTGTSEKLTTKLYLAGGETQSATGVVTYSNSKCYVGTDNKLYSNDEAVLTLSTLPVWDGTVN